MMAAAQPHVSGGVGHAIVLPRTATVDDCRALFRLAGALGLKSLAIAGREPAIAEPVRHEAPPAEVAQGMPLSLVATAATANTDAEMASSETAIATDGTAVNRDAETSRCASSLAARGAASVPSSADAVVEQRQV
jgi:ribonucleotide reductase alpha subunit